MSMSLVEHPKWINKVIRLSGWCGLVSVPRLSSLDKVLVVSAVVILKTTLTFLCRQMSDVCQYCRKQHSLWVQGDVHRSKQKILQQRQSRRKQLQEQRQQQQHQSPEPEGKTMSCLLSSMDDLSLNTTMYKSYSVDEVYAILRYFDMYHMCILKLFNPILTLCPVCLLCRTTAGTAAV